MVDAAGGYRGFGPMGPLAGLGESSNWPAMEALAHTVVLASQASDDRLHHWAKKVGETLPSASRRTLKGEWHGVAAEDLAPVLAEFFNENN